MSEIYSGRWPATTIKKSVYLKGRIGWQGLRASEFLEEGVKPRAILSRLGVETASNSFHPGV